MPDWGHPGWLLVLALIPLVRWLHRRGAGSAPMMVPATFLWRDLAPPPPGRERMPPDPAWRRRAVLVGLLSLALAAPRWDRTSAPRVEVWVDDGPSLFSREPDGQSRLQGAGRALAAALASTRAAAGAETAELRALRRPGEVRRLSGLDVAGNWAGAGVEALLAEWLDGPAPGPLPAPAQVAPPPPGTERWLVTDGADPRAVAALPAVTLSRVIGIGRATDNQAVTALALRPSLTTSGESLALVGVVNAGPQPRRRTLTLARGGEILATWPLTLAPGEVQTRTLRVATAASAGLAATLLPAPQGSVQGDALSLDDTLGLAPEAGPTALPVRVPADCPAQVRAALAAHPGLDLSPDPSPNPGLNPSLNPSKPRPARLRLWCSGTWPPGDDPLPTLWLRPGPGALPVAGVPVWAPEMAGVAAPPLGRVWSRVAPGAMEGPVEGATEEVSAGRVLLGAEGVPLILETEAPGGVPVIEVRLATTDPGPASSPEFPVLLAVLLDRLADRTGNSELLAPIAGVSRDPLAARIAPGPLPQPGAAPVSLTERREAAPWLLAAALLVLGWDLRRLGRPGRGA